MILILIDPIQNTERCDCKLLIGSIVPQPIAPLMAQSELGAISGTPFNYLNAFFQSTDDVADG